jgi:Tol biopolymer transport system component
VAGDTNAYRDVFVRDIAEGTTSRISLSSTGVQSNANSSSPWISADGRFVTFVTTASNLVANDTNNVLDVFVHDRNTRITTRVSVDSAGSEGNGYCLNPSISANGQFVAFESEASNLVASDTNGLRDVFVHDRNTGITTRVSVDSAGNQSEGLSERPQISANGRYVAFNSWAANLVAGDTTITDVFVHDRNTRATTRVSVDSAGHPANADSWRPSISADGRYISFNSYASNLVAGDTNTYVDIFVHDRSTGKTTRANVSSTGVQANGPGDYSATTGVGRYVAFESGANNLVAGDTNNGSDIFVRDLVAGTTRRVSLDAFGAEANDYSIGVERGALSADGRYVAFASYATNLAPDDVNGKRDVFVRAIPHLTISSVSPKMLPIGATRTIIIRGTDFLPGTSLSVEGAKLSNYIVWNETTISADVTVQAGQTAGSRDVQVSLAGTGAGPYTGSLGLCADCVTFF